MTNESDLPFLWCVIMSLLGEKKAWLALTARPLWPQPWCWTVHTASSASSPDTGTTSRSGLKTGDCGLVSSLRHSALLQPGGRESLTRVWAGLQIFT